METTKNEISESTISPLGGCLQTQEDKDIRQEIINECAKLLQIYSQSRDVIVEAIGNLWSKLTYYQEGRGISMTEFEYWCEELIKLSESQNIIPADKLDNVLKLASDFLLKLKQDTNVRYATYNGLLNIDNLQIEELSTLLVEHLSKFYWDGMGFAIHLLKLKSGDNWSSIIISKYKDSSKWDQINKQMENYM